jgi:hypothetical protein
MSLAHSKARVCVTCVHLQAQPPDVWQSLEAALECSEVLLLRGLEDE